MRLFIDDIRDPKDGREWVVVRSYRAAIDTILTHFNEITEISFDHDLGEGKTGYDIAVEVEKLVDAKHLINVPVMHVHSRNPVGAKRLKQAIDSIERMALANSQ